ncbi:Hippocalcin-like protein 1 [Mactra antiquata]
MGNSSAKTQKLKLRPQSIEELQQIVEFTPEEIQAWYAEYRSSLASNQAELTKEEFKKVYNTLFIGDASKFAEHIFRTFDTDNSGTVNFKKFLVGLCVSGRESDTECKLRWAFRMYDVNGDGYISKEEMREIIEAIFKMTNAILPEGIGSAEEMADSFFHRFDTNADGRITYEEFKDGAKEDSVIIKLLECDPDI